MKKLVLAFAVLTSFGVSAEQQCRTDMDRTTPTARYIDNDNGTVTDRATKLTWMRCSIGQTYNKETASCDGMPSVFFWQDALQTAENMRSSDAHEYYQFAGVSNWRLPNIKELNSIREHGCANPAVNDVIFPNIMAIAEAEGGYAYLWSSTHLAVDTGIMIMDLNGGSLSSTGSVNDYQRQVLMVADPQ